MTEVDFKAENQNLKTENENLRNKMLVSQAQQQGLQAHLDAHKDMFNEQANNSLNLRTNMILIAKAGQEKDQQIKDLSGQIELLKKQIDDLTAKLVAASVPVEVQP